MHTRLNVRQTILNFLLEKNLGRSDSESWADALVDQLLPVEGEEDLELETCGQCGGKGHITIVIDHGNKSRTYWNALCGRCYGTGKLTEARREYF